jgi:hypothetical protein
VVARQAGISARCGDEHTGWAATSLLRIWCISRPVFEGKRYGGDHG